MIKDHPPVVSETCSCGASTQRLAVVADPFEDWRRDHVCGKDPAGPVEPPVGNDPPGVIDAGEVADAIGFRLLGEPEE